MTNDEAKFILNAYRPDGSDAGDLTFAVALEQTRQDPALGAWFLWQQDFDRAMTAKLGQIAPPADLREAILAGVKLSQPATARRSWWNQPTWIAVAASVAVLFAVTAGLLWPKNAAANAALTDFAMADTLRGELHGGHGEGEQSMRAMLGRADRPLCSSLAISFANLRASGCRTVNFEGRDVIEICFKRNGAWYHCYIARRADFAGLAVTATPSIIDRRGVAVAAWADAEHVFLVTGKNGRAALQQLL